MSNIFEHVLRDYAEQVTLAAGAHVFGTPAGSKVDVQTALEQFDAHILSPAEIPPAATELNSGIVQISTVTETNEQDLDSVVVTPARLATFKTFASPPSLTQIGFPRFCTDAEMAGTNDTNAFTVTKLNKYITSDRPASETVTGVSVLATNTDALEKTNATKIMTPLRMREAILSETSRRIDATETVHGVIRLATQGDVMSSMRDVAVTPASLNYKVGSVNTRGLYNLVTASMLAGEFNTQSAYEDFVVTPGTMVQVVPTATRYGFAMLTDNLTTTSAAVALTASQGKVLQADKVGVSGGTITGTLKTDNLYADLRVYEKAYYGNSWQYNAKDVTVKVINAGKVTPLGGLEGRPIGSFYLTTNPTDPTILFGGTWVQVKGRTFVGAGRGVDINGINRTYNSGNESGSYGVKLTQNNLPKHNHAGWGETYSNAKSVCVEWEEHWTYAGPVKTCVKYETTDYWRFGIASEYGRSNMGMAKTDGDNYMYYNEPVGGSEIHNNTMPYTTIYIWRRIR